MGQGRGCCRGGSALPRVQTENNIHGVRHSESDRDRVVGREAKSGTQRERDGDEDTQAETERTTGTKIRAERQKDRSLTDREREMERENSHRVAREIEREGRATE